MNLKDKELLSPKDVAEICGVSMTTVYAWIREKRLPATKLGQWKISKDNLEKALGMSIDKLIQLQERE